MCTKNKAIFDVKVIDVEDEITDIKKTIRRIINNGYSERRIVLMKKSN